MTRYHLKNNNVRVPFTAEEETARDIKEQAWIDGAFDRAIAQLRLERNNLLSETDFYALQDVTISEDMTTYRQALRDLPSGLTTVEEVQAVTFPVKP
tara:strand:+ start:603 stop:893 length:291 start_codon:yes stop_codon:yes gene_type:complete